MHKKKYIFLSYSRKDNDFAMQLKDDLQKRGFDVWVDQKKISGGEVWRKSIANALVDSHTVVWVVSPDSVNSKYVNKELSFADGKDVRIIPVMYKKAEIPFPYHELQFVDVSDEDEYENSLNEILESLKRGAGGGNDLPKFLKKIRQKLYMANSERELQFLLYEIDNCIKNNYMSIEAKMLKDDILKAIKWSNRQVVAKEMPNKAFDKYAIYKKIYLFVIIIFLFILKYFLTKNTEENIPIQIKTDNVTSLNIKPDKSAIIKVTTPVIAPKTTKKKPISQMKWKQITKEKLSQRDAIYTCRKSGLRLASVKELKALADDEKIVKKIKNNNAFPYDFWSSTVYKKDKIKAYIFRFNDKSTNRVDINERFNFLCIKKND